MIEQGVAHRISALTFTNKAAEQMRERIAQMIPDNRSRYIRMGTFLGFAYPARTPTACFPIRSPSTNLRTARTC